jgi:hypothetical protein
MGYCNPVANQPKAHKQKFTYFEWKDVLHVLDKEAIRSGVYLPEVIRNATLEYAKRIDPKFEERHVKFLASEPLPANIKLEANAKLSSRPQRKGG